MKRTRMRAIAVTKLPDHPSALALLTLISATQEAWEALHDDKATDEQKQQALADVDVMAAEWLRMTDPKALADGK